jgi:hypothetical membrane protein
MATVNQPSNRTERFKCAAGSCGRGLGLICLTTLSGILAPLLFLMAMMVMESIQPDYNPFRESVSRLAIGLHGRFQTLSFFIFGFLFAVFSIRLYLATSRTMAARVGAVLFLLSGAGFFIIGVFHVAPDSDARWIMTGRVHGMSANMTGTAFILGCLAFAAYFRIDKRWHNYFWFTLVIAIVCLGFSLAWKISPHTWTWKGLAERLMLLTGFLWIELVSIRLLRFCIGKKTGIR